MTIPTSPPDRIDRLVERRRILTGATGFVFLTIGLGALIVPSLVLDLAWLGWPVTALYAVILFWLFRAAGRDAARLDDEITRSDMRDAQSFGFLVYAVSLSVAGVLALAGILPLLNGFIAAVFISPGGALVSFAVRSKG